MTKWEEYLKLLEEHEGKSLRQLEPIFKKDHSWIGKLRQFYKATEEEKKELSEKHAQFLKFYELYQEYKKVKEEEQKKEEEKPDPELLIKHLASELKECRKLKEDLIKENAEDALEINRLRNKIIELEIENTRLNNTLNAGKNLIYSLNIFILFIISYLYFK